MRISARGISKGHALPQVTVHARSGEVRLVAVEGGQRPSVLGLLLSGRMAPDTGEVTVDGEPDAARLRRTVALIDAPDVSAPYDDLTLESVLREELAFAGVRRTRRTAARLLADWNAADQRAVPLRAVPAALRVRALAEAATMRAGTEAAVIVSPDRHGGDPAGWYDVADRLARRGLAVIVLAGAAAIAALERDEPAPDALATLPAEPAEAEPEPAPEPGPERAPEPSRASDAAPEHDAGSAPEPAVDAAPEPDVGAAPAGAPEAEPTAEPDRRAAEPEPAPDNNPEPEPDAATDPRPEPEPDPTRAPASDPTTPPRTEAPAEEMPS